MIASFLNIFKIPELRRKVFITLALCFVYRVGAHVPTPFIDPHAMSEHFKTLGGGSGQGVFAVVDMFSGGAFKQMTIFALGIMPYISASIILQLLTVVWPRLEKIAKEGEAGRKKINQWTRYGTVVLSLFQGAGLGVYLNNSSLSIIPDHPWLLYFTTAVTMSAGTCFVMWLGEKMTEHGIGNGISIIIAIGIIASYPMSLKQGVINVQGGGSPLIFGLVLVAMLVFSALTIITQQANRKIPIQHARRMVGRKLIQGGSATHLPIKLNVAGVIPVIFSSSILSFPQLLIGGLFPQSLGMFFNDWMGQTSNHNVYELFNLESGGVFSLLKVINLWTVLYVILTAFFCYFYTALTFNPVDVAENLKKSGAFIPGKKPGKPTSDYINYILVRTTVVGAGFLIAIALIPDVFYVSFNVPYMFASIAGGTGLIIVVGVVLDTMKQIESQLLMRHYDGFTYRGTGGATGRRRTARR